jgi:hypothetical protein
MGRAAMHIRPVKTAIWSVLYYPMPADASDGSDEAGTCG